MTVAILNVWESPATGFEPSIYAATPPALWAILIFSLIFGICIVVHGIYASELEDHKSWILGLTLILLVYTTMLALWIIKGYALWGTGDPMSHLGTTQDLIANYHSETDNFYPITHIFLAQLSQICGISVLIPYKCLPLIFGVLCIPFMYMFAKSVLPEKGQVILATVASTTFVLGWYLNLMPNALSNLMMPLAIFLLIKSFSPGTVQWRILFVVIIFLYPPFHPNPAFALLLISVTLWLPSKIKAISSGKTTEHTASVFKINFPASLLLLIWTITWISSFYLWDMLIRNTHKLLIGNAGMHVERMAEMMQYAQGYGYSVTEYFFKVYGGVLVFILLAVAALPVIWKRMSTETNYRSLAALYGPLAAFSLGLVALYFSNIGSSPSRFLIYITIICIMFTGFMLYEIMQRIRRSYSTKHVYKLAALLVAVTLSAVSINGIATLYPSHYTLSISGQSTRTEIAGMDWFLHRKDIGKELTNFSIAPARFADLLLTPDERRTRSDIHQFLAANLQLPFHFGYDKNPTLGSFYCHDTYLVLNEKDSRIYQDMYPEMAKIRFLPEDFENLNRDTSLDRLYANGGFDSYYIHGLAESA